MCQYIHFSLFPSHEALLLALIRYAVSQTFPQSGSRLEESQQCALSEGMT